MWHKYKEREGARELQACLQGSDYTEFQVGLEGNEGMKVDDGANLAEPAIPNKI